MKRPYKQAAFTIIELLIVMLIMGVLVVLAVPALSSALRGMELSQATQLVNDQIRLARQTALTKNHSVEVRFYSYADPQTVNSQGKRYFQALQTFELNDDGTARAIGKRSKLPASIIIDSNSSQLSTLLDSSLKKVWTAQDTNIPLPGIGTNYDAYAFQFRPDGSANLSVSDQPWCITLHFALGGDNLNALPKNFSTIQIDPWNGRVRIFRP